MRPENRKSTPSVKGADLLILLLLLGLLGAEALAWQVRHRSEKELWQLYRAGEPEEKIHALHVLTNRGRPRGFSQEFVQEMLRSEQATLREFTMTYDLTRLSGRKAQLRYLGSPLVVHDETVRARFFFRHQNSRFSRALLRRYFEAVRAASPHRGRNRRPS